MVFYSSFIYLQVTRKAKGNNSHYSQGGLINLESFGEVLHGSAMVFEQRYSNLNGIAFF